MASLAAYNALFLVYVAIFGLGLYAFIFSMMSFDLKTLPQSFSELDYAIERRHTGTGQVDGT